MRGAACCTCASHTARQCKRTASWIDARIVEGHLFKGVLQRHGLQDECLGAHDLREGSRFLVCGQLVHQILCLARQRLQHITPSTAWSEQKPEINNEYSKQQAGPWHSAHVHSTRHSVLGGEQSCCDPHQVLNRSSSTQSLRDATKAHFMVTFSDAGRRVRVQHRMQL